VAQQVAQKLGKKFDVPLHTKAWKYYKIHKSGKQAEGCDTRYCQYDEPHSDYIYTEEWVLFLINKLSDDSEYEQVRSLKRESYAQT
jgi:hypothetical protein